MPALENPQNGYRENVGITDAMLVFVLGPIWFLARGLYAIGALDLVIYALVIVGIASGNDNTAGALFFFVFLPVHIGTTLAATALIRRHFSRLGWRAVEIDQPREAQTEPIEKVCPQCAETIKAAARVCRFCGHAFTEA